LVDVPRIKLTKHAAEKFDLIRHYGFEVTMKQVIETVLNPECLDERAGQYFAIKTINPKHALKVVYEKRKGYLVVITFYPVRRERYGI